MTRTAKVNHLNSCATFLGNDVSAEDFRRVYHVRLITKEEKFDPDDKLFIKFHGKNNVETDFKILQKVHEYKLLKGKM